MARHRKKAAYSKVVVAVMFATIIAFVEQCMFFYWNGRPVDAVLVTAFFLCFGFEFGSLAFIKRGEQRVRYVGGRLGDKQLGHVEVMEGKEEPDE